MEVRRPGFPPRAGCPKHMVFGPCGGVRPEGACEVPDAGPCVFVADPVLTWPGVDRPGGDRAAGRYRPSGRPWVVTDLHARPYDAESLRAVTSALAGTCDTVLVGDHGARRPDFPPVIAAELLVGMGVRPWVTLSCRDRTRAELEGACAALVDFGVAGVHCVTGDWVTGAGTAGAGRAGPAFELDSLRLVELAAGHGLQVSVAATPGAPPTWARPPRMAAKAAAGARVCFVNHCGGPAAVARFVAAAREAGADMDYVPCVPVISDAASAAVLAALPGLVLDARVVGDVRAGGAGPEAGVAAAAAEAKAMLAIPGVTGVNLSGAASTRSEVASAAMMAELGRRVKQTSRGAMR